MGMLTATDLETVAQAVERDIIAMVAKSNLLCLLSGALYVGSGVGHAPLNPKEESLSLLVSSGFYLYTVNPIGSTLQD